jgi:hypothetical protein
MISKALNHFATKIAAKNRIGFGDVRRLQRDILPDGLMTREEAELLLALDRSIGRADRAWSEFLVGAVVEFVVWSERPTGQVDEDMTRWLAGVLGSGPLTRSGRLITLEIAREANSGTAQPEGMEAEAAAPSLSLPPSETARVASKPTFLA